jgi:hypothetical protein
VTRRTEKKVSYSGERTIFMFDILREAACRQVEQAEATDRGALYPTIMAIVATAFFLEAGLNHIGNELVGGQQWAKMERELSPARKLAKIAHRVDPAAKLDLGSAPYGTFGTIFRLRNTFAHGKTETVARKFWSYDFVHPNKFLRAKWEQHSTPEHARRYFDDALAMLTDLLTRAGLENHLYRASTSDWEST